MLAVHAVDSDKPKKSKRGCALLQQPQLASPCLERFLKRIAVCEQAVIVHAFIRLQREAVSHILQYNQALVRPLAFGCRRACEGAAAKREAEQLLVGDEGGTVLRSHRRPVHERSSQQAVDSCAPLDLREGGDEGQWHLADHVGLRRRLVGFLRRQLVELVEESNNLHDAQEPPSGSLVDREAGPAESPLQRFLEEDSLTVHCDLAEVRVKHKHGPGSAPRLCKRDTAESVSKLGCNAMEFRDSVNFRDLVSAKEREPTKHSQNIQTRTVLCYLDIEPRQIFENARRRPLEILSGF